MVVASLKIQFLLPGCASLKQKRFILSSLKVRLRNRFNIAVCENDYHDKWQRSELGLVTVALDKRGAEKIAQQVMDFLEREHRIVICECERNYY